MRVYLEGFCGRHRGQTIKQVKEAFGEIPDALWLEKCDNCGKISAMAKAPKNFKCLKCNTLYCLNCNK